MTVASSPALVPSSRKTSRNLSTASTGWFLIAFSLLLSSHDGVTSFSHHPRTATRSSRHWAPSSPIVEISVGGPTSASRRQISTFAAMGTASSSAATADAQSPLDARTIETFRGKNVLITGASRGLGRSLALQLARCGDDDESNSSSTLILSGRDQAALEKVAEECRKTCSSSSLVVETIPCDLSSKDDVSQLGDAAVDFCAKRSEGNGRKNSGCVDVLINNGGISSRSSFLETKMEVDEQLMQVNFLAGAALAKKVVPGMVDQTRGCIVWISTVQGKVGTPFRTSYAASKFAVQGYCEALRSELATSGVTVHVASPGYIRTNLSMSAVTGDGNAYNKMDETTAKGADPDEVACTILDSVAAGNSDFIVAATLSAKAALWLKFLAPSFLETMLVKRFEKSRIKS